MPPASEPLTSPGPRMALAFPAEHLPLLVLGYVLGLQEGGGRVGWAGPTLV